MPSLLVEWESERALQKAFEAESLPLSIITNRELLIPLPAMIGVFQRAAQATGRRDFGLRVGQGMQFQSYGLLSRYWAQADTLGHALQRSAATIHRLQSGTQVYPVFEGDMVIWRYQPKRGRTGHTQHTDHVLPPMVSLFRHFLGHSWTPAWFEVDYPRDCDAHVIEELLEAPVKFDRPTVGIALPRCLMNTKRPHPLEKPITPFELEAEDSIPIRDEPMRSIVAVAILRLMDGKTDIEGTALMAGVSVRTLQRQLSIEGFSYRKLVERVRMRRARALLEDTSLTITQIALMLGYSEHANFTRAFNRWTGLSPAGYRRHHHKLAAWRSQ